MKGLRLIIALLSVYSLYTLSVYTELSCCCFVLQMDNGIELVCLFLCMTVLCVINVIKVALTLEKEKTDRIRFRIQIV